MKAISQHDFSPSDQEIESHKHPDGLWSGAEAEKRAFRERVEEELDEFDEENMTIAERRLLAILQVVVKKLL